jgi:subtilisin-like proprotein convertase family protein
MYVDADGDVAEADETNNHNRGDGLDRQTVFYSASFSNTANITIPSSGAATAYPSNIVVSGMPGTVADVNVSLFGLAHSRPDDIDVLLVGPAGQKMILMSDVGGSNSITNVNLVFDDEAANSLPDSGQLTSGTFKPTNIGTGDTFTSPAPAGPYGSLLSGFDGTNPNGTWRLYVVDDSILRSGSISGGWGLTFALAIPNTPPTNPTNVALPAIDEDTAAASNPGRLVSSIVSASGSTDANGNSLGIAVTSIDNSHGQWQYSTNGGGTWLDISIASLAIARLLSPANYVRFNPNADFNSAIAVSPVFGFKVWDQTTGAAGGTADTTTGTAFSVASAQVTQPVTAVNDAPSFALTSTLVARNEDAGAVSMSGFATNIRPAAATATDEAGQVLAFQKTIVGTTSTLAFDVAPVIDPITGALTFTSTADSNGTATIEVVLQDNGSGTPPNVNTSAPQTITIEIAAVNDEETLTTNAGMTVDEGSTATITTALLETTDIDNTPAELVYTITSGPTYGTILVGGTAATQFTQQQVNDGLVSYQHGAGESLADGFDFSVDDGQGSASTGTFSITIRPFAGDYNNNEIVDAADYVLWRKTLGVTGVPAFSGADGDGDGAIDENDYDLWRADFGNTQSPPAAGSGIGQASSSSIASQELQAGGVANRGILAGQDGESVVLIPSETMSAFVNANAGAAQFASLAGLETSSVWQDPTAPSRAGIQRYFRAEPIDGGLSQLLAIDRIEQSLRQDAFVSDENVNGAHRADNSDCESEIDESLAGCSLHSEDPAALSLFPVDYRGWGSDQA